MDLIELNIQKQIDKVKKEIRVCKNEELDSLKDKYNMFNNIKNTIDEELIGTKQFQKILEEDSDILDKIYNKVQNLNMHTLPPTFDEVMLETFLEEFSKTREYEENEDEL